MTTPAPLPGGFTSATYYIDNFTLTANPVPEPAAAGLTVLALGGLALRRRDGNFLPGLSGRPGVS